MVIVLCAAALAWSIAFLLSLKRDIEWQNQFLKSAIIEAYYAAKPE
jgi:hypothetical protein